MCTDKNELEQLISLQEDIILHLIKLGLSYENEGKTEQAAMIYKRGIEAADKLKVKLSATLLGLLG